MFAASAARYPDAPAVSDAKTQLTYAELDGRSEQLAKTLADYGVGSEDRVGMYMERGVDVVVAMLGILKAGGAYVPVDTRYPAARRDFMLNQGRIKVLVAQPGWGSRLSTTSFNVVEWESEPAPPSGIRAVTRGVTPANAACVLYTSGSSGIPKGVVLEHRQLVLLATNAALSAPTPEDKVAQISNISFGPVNLEVWSSLIAGAEIVVLPDITELMAGDLQRELKHRRITVMIAPAIAINQIVQEDRKAFLPLRILYSSGDVIRPATCRSLLAGGFEGQLVNLYGSTETTVACTAYTVREVPPGATTVPIGKTLEGYRLYVLGSDLNRVSCGDVGELYVGGRGVARGYLDQPDLAPRGFLSDPFTDGRMYATGDMVRENEQGDLEFLGRIENKVEIRGHRVEPGEVERTLCQYSEVNEASVFIDGQAGNRRLVAFLVPSGEFVSLRGLCSFLQEVVPDYMVPEDFVVLPALPIDAHGKRDRGALAKLLDERNHQRAEYVAPRNGIERYLVHSWEELLATRHISVLDDFFSLGGHSLLAYRVHTYIKRDLGVELDFQLVFENSVLQDLAKVIEKARQE